MAKRKTKAPDRAPYGGYTIILEGDYLVARGPLASTIQVSTCDMAIEDPYKRLTEEIDRASP